MNITLDVPIDSKVSKTVGGLCCSLPGCMKFRVGVA